MRECSIARDGEGGRESDRARKTETARQRETARTRQRGGGDTARVRRGGRKRETARAGQKEGLSGAQRTRRTCHIILETGWSVKKTFPMRIHVRTLEVSHRKTPVTTWQTLGRRWRHYLRGSCCMHHRLEVCSKQSPHHCSIAYCKSILWTLLQQIEILERKYRNNVRQS